MRISDWSSDVCSSDLMKDDSEFLGTVAKDVEQHLPADADKAVARRTIDLAAVMDLNVVPVREAISNRPRADRVVRLQVSDGLVGEDHAPAEGHPLRVALEYVPFVGGVAQLHSAREVDRKSVVEGKSV